MIRAPHPIRAAAAVLAAACALAPAALAAQDNRLEELIAPYTGVNAAGYLEPLGQILGGSLNSGFIRSADIGGRYIRLDVAAAVSLISDDQKVFRGVTQGLFVPETTAAAPTIVGSATPAEVEGEGGLVYVFPAGLAIRRVVLPIAQLTAGSIAGTEATVRWLGFAAGDLGDFRLLGLGARHSLSRYLPGVPADLAVGALYHSLALGDVLDLTALLVSLQASKQRGPLVGYAGLGYETSSMRITYEHTGAEPIDLGIDVDGATGVRLTGGLALDLPFLTLHADYSMGAQRLLTLGVGIGN